MTHPTPLWRKFSILLLLATGLITTIATSQPQWSIEGQTTIDWQADTQQINIEAIASLPQLQHGDNFYFSFTIAPTGPGAATQIDLATWTFDHPGSPDDPTILKWNTTEQGIWTSTAYGYPLQCPDQTSCPQTFTLQRSNEGELVANIKITAILNGVGDQPTGNKNLTLKATR